MKYSLRTLILFASIFTGETVFAQLSGLTCNNFQGTPVYQQAAPVQGAMATTLPNGQPVIRFNPNHLGHFTQIMRDFIYAHECAHHTYGHGTIVPAHTIQSEQQADCYAIQALVYQLGLNPHYIPQIQAQVASFGPGDWAHLPGPIRAQNLSFCLQ